MALGPSGGRVAVSPAQSKPGGAEQSRDCLRTSGRSRGRLGARLTFDAPLRRDRCPRSGRRLFLPAGTGKPLLDADPRRTIEITVRDFAAGAQFDGLKDSDTLKKQWTSCTVFSDLDVDGPGATDPNFYCAPTVTKAFFVLLSQQANSARWSRA